MALVCSTHFSFTSLHVFISTSLVSFNVLRFNPLISYIYGESYVFPRFFFRFSIPSLCRLNDQTVFFRSLPNSLFLFPFLSAHVSVFCSICPSFYLCFFVFWKNNYFIISRSKCIWCDHKGNNNVSLNKSMARTGTNWFWEPFCDSIRLIWVLFVPIHSKHFPLLFVYACLNVCVLNVSEWERWNCNGSCFRSYCHKFVFDSVNIVKLYHLKFTLVKFLIISIYYHRCNHHIIIVILLLLNTSKLLRCLFIYLFIYLSRKV